MAKKKILIIEDESDLVDLVKIRLEANQYDVISAPDGKAGLEKIKKERPDLIILDVLMPEMDGFEVCRKIRVDDKYKKIPVIMLTVKFQPSDLKFARDLGADAYITKPFEPEVLLEYIKKLLKV